MNTEAETTPRKKTDPNFRTARLFECACGWYRDYCFAFSWKSEIVDHPIYGPRDNITIAQMDIKHHSCEQHKRAVKRARKLRYI